MSSDAETRERLLAAAERLFGNHGFKKVTVRAICREAQANVAAVNYHFGDKLGLYREVLHAAIEMMRSTNDAARAAGEGQRPEEKLRRYIVTHVSQLLASGDNPWLYRLINREITDPTPALDAIVEQGLRPRIEYLSEVVADIIGCDVSDRRVLRCVASIQSQSVAYLRNPIAARLGFAPKPTPSRVREIAAHIADFSLAGVRAVGRRKTLRRSGSPEALRYRMRRRVAPRL